MLVSAYIHNFVYTLKSPHAGYCLDEFRMYRKTWIALSENGRDVLINKFC